MKFFDLYNQFLQGKNQIIWDMAIDELKIQFKRSDAFITPINEKYSRIHFKDVPIEKMTKSFLQPFYDILKSKGLDAEINEFHGPGSGHCGFCINNSLPEMLEILQSKNTSGLTN